MCKNSYFKMELCGQKPPAKLKDRGFGVFISCDITIPFEIDHSKLFATGTNGANKRSPWA